MTKQQRRRIVALLEIGVAIAAGAAISFRLAPYGLPFFLHAACVLGTACAVLSALLNIEQTWTGTTHRCTAPGCDFRVRIQHADAGENRRWQEAAADHPFHTA
ncbi:hypothetical protein [Streptomyces sp. AcE210]|uniref:hypothetical protein n=1 Tax=Streptomyces sp. AcE210 TaxID=2292703 RepID=UPI000E309142|nr:hypothetical protein [Streptomyces sp. AcE210]RFC75500.1 hypothetical protein DXZ75_13380 [Streptomyces sp. AcE210]